MRTADMTELARAFIAGRPGRCHNAHTDGQTYTPHTSPIVVKNGNALLFFWHGYYTRTTASHMNEVLRAAGADFRVSYAIARDTGDETFMWEMK